jgi:hypothetical protein
MNDLVQTVDPVHHWANGLADQDWIRGLYSSLPKGHATYPLHDECCSTYFAPAPENQRCTAAWCHACHNDVIARSTGPLLPQAMGRVANVSVKRYYHRPLPPRQRGVGIVGTMNDPIDSSATIVDVVPIVPKDLSSCREELQRTSYLGLRSTCRYLVVSILILLMPPKTGADAVRLIRDLDLVLLEAKQIKIAISGRQSCMRLESMICEAHGIMNISTSQCCNILAGLVRISMRLLCVASMGPSIPYMSWCEPEDWVPLLEQERREASRRIGCQCHVRSDEISVQHTYRLLNRVNP